MSHKWEKNVLEAYLMNSSTTFQYSSVQYIRVFVFHAALTQVMTAAIATSLAIGYT